MEGLTIDPERLDLENETGIYVIAQHPRTKKMGCS